MLAGTLIPNNLVERLSTVLEETSTETTEEEFKDESKDENSKDGQKEEDDDDDDDIQEIQVIRSVRKDKNVVNDILKKEVSPRNKIRGEKVVQDDKQEVKKEKIDGSPEIKKELRVELKKENRVEVKIKNKNNEEKESRKDSKEHKKRKEDDIKVEMDDSSIEPLLKKGKIGRIEKEGNNGEKTPDGEGVKKEFTLSKTGILKGKKIAIKVIEVKKPKDEKWRHTK